jgi:hypothetical protein
MKHNLYDPVYVTTEHAFGEVRGWRMWRDRTEVHVHLYHKPADETIIVPEEAVLEHLGPETGEAGDRA